MGKLEPLSDLEAGEVFPPPPVYCSPSLNPPKPLPPVTSKAKGKNESKTSKVVTGTTCFTGHKLRRFAVMNGSICERCEKTLDKGTKTMSCRKCDYDICKDCDKQAVH